MGHLPSSSLGPRKATVPSEVAVPEGFAFSWVPPMLLTLEAQSLDGLYPWSYCSQDRVPAAHWCVFTQGCAAPLRATINFIEGT